MITQNEKDLLLELAKSELERAIVNVKHNQNIVKSLGPAIVELLKPVLNKIEANTVAMRQDIVKSLTGLKVEINPQVNLPPINIPPAKVNVAAPIVNVPDIFVPEPKVTVNVPESKLSVPDGMSVSLRGVSAKSPLPVMVLNQQGGPRSGLTLSDIVSPSGDSLIDSVNKALRINAVVGGGGGTQYNDASTPDQSGGIGTITMLFDGGSNRSFRGSSYGVPTVQLSGFDGSLIGITANALDINAKSWGTSIDTNIGPSGSNTLRVTQATDAVSSVNIVSGSIANTGFNITGQDENSGPVSPSTLRIVQAVDIGLSAKTIAVAMTTNPTAASDAADTFIRADKLGRAINTPVQVRQLRSTAYATLNSNAETTLLASPASTFLDLIYISFANTSAAAVNVDLRSETGAGIVNTFALPANATQGFATPVPWPQNTLAATWTVKFNGADISNTTVYANALFEQET